MAVSRVVRLPGGKITKLTARSADELDELHIELERLCVSHPATCGRQMAYQPIIGKTA
jgi:hypothetical protein